MFGRDGTHHPDFSSTTLRHIALALVIGVIFEKGNGTEKGKWSDFLSPDSMGVEQTHP
jgi:hypothetical protein